MAHYTSHPLDELLTVKALEAALAQPAYRLTFTPTAKRADIERTNFPSMIQCFEQQRKPNGLPPTQSEFVNGFVALHQAARPALFAPPARAATVARLQKAYPSLVRDLHLYLLCRESKLFTRVWRGALLDEFYGVDVLIVDAQNREYYICATAGTSSAAQWRALKQQLRNRIRPERAQLTGVFIELSLDVRPKKVIAQWWLYTPAHTRYIAEQIERVVADR
jgi:hypothetical protein